MVAKEMAKTKSLAASFRNISDYLSLIDRARQTIQGIEAHLKELDNTVSEAAGLIDSDDYNSVSVGAIAGASIDGLASGSGTFESVPSQTTNGNGTGSTFTIRANGIGNYEIINIDPMAPATQLMIRLPLLAPHLVAPQTTMTRSLQSPISVD